MDTSIHDVLLSFFDLKISASSNSAYLEARVSGDEHSAQVLGSTGA